MNWFATHASTARHPRSRASWLVAAVLASGSLAVLAAPAQAAGPTMVTLEFDNSSISVYNLGYLQALQPHNASAAFFVQSGSVVGGANQMSWAQLGTLASAGNDIGGKSVSSANLTTDPNASAQVCNDRAAIISHGLTPVGFAYPGGASNATVQDIVKACGYGSGRTAGGIGTTSVPETLPPANWFATKAYAPTAVTLANLQAVVNNAVAKGGGLIQVVMGRVCSQTLDAANYTSCSAASGHIELAELNAFLDWMANTGQAGGAPAGAALSRFSTVVGAVDTTAPVTTITCNGAPCAATPYAGLVSVTLAATDTGSGLAATRYTTDGSDPTLASPTYTGPFNVNGANSSTTVKFRSWDYQGNAEATQTQVVMAPTDSESPTTTVSCNGAACGSTAYVATVTIALSATDTGGSGVDKTYYTTDGSAPTTASPTYSAPFQLNTPGTYQLKFFSTDKAGNAEPVQTQQVTVAPVTTKVSLTFDNGTVGQYTLAYLKALKPHGANATFYVNSGTVGVSGNIMNWAQVADLSAAGNDIGGKSVNASNLTTDPDPTAQVCNDRTTLRQHGLDPVGFAYPGGASNAAVKDIVRSCGYGVARSAGSLSPTGPTYAEKLPPNDWYATRAWAPGGQVTLANMKALVTGAASHGGGWSQIVFTRVCSQTEDPNGYAACTAASGWVDLGDLNDFLDWMAAAGQNGAAPAGAALTTVREAAISADTIAPASTATCNGAACAPGTYTQTVYVALAGTDVGSAVASIHYTKDGSTPDLGSPAYTKRIPITATTTLKWRAYDHAGNAEAVNSQVVDVNLPSDTTPPTTTIACDGAPCTTDGYNGSTMVSLTADDGSGYGVDATYYTTDGTAPTTSSNLYDVPFKLGTAGTYNVRWFSTDLAGNAEASQSQQIQVLEPRVVVSLTFDDGLLTQYLLADKLALKPHHLAGTFYNVSGQNNVDEQHMTWAQLTDLNNDGHEIGGHTVDHVSLKGMTDLAQLTYQVCQDRQNLIDHGFDPTSFAYPTGAYDAQAESVVQGCGYTSARAAGGIDVAGEGAGPVYTETIPPKDAFALRTLYDPPTGSPANVPPLTLSHLKSAVTAAADHDGGWVTVAFHEICSQQYDPANYDFCMSDWGPIELTTFNAFLDWLNASGQAGGAPPRTVVKTVSEVMNGPDTLSPVSTLSCNGSACASSAYAGSVTVAFSAQDPGGTGVAATYYTTDGSTPTTASPKAGRAFTINQDTTFKFFSVDNAGNTEGVQTVVVQAAPRTDPVIAAAGDIACDPQAPAFNFGLGTDADCRAAHTAPLLQGADAVLPVGDTQYNCGGPAAYAQSYDPTWGVMKSVTRPVPGDEEYETSGGTDCLPTPGAGYYGYFGSAAGDPTKGYYSYDLGQWHVVALNTAPCPEASGFCAAGSAQEQWLRQDLASHTTGCTLAYFQNPRWASTVDGVSHTTYQPFWQDLYDGGVDVVLNGDAHWYERFKPLDASGVVNQTYGVRQFVVGTGGAGLDEPGNKASISDVLNNSTHGVLRMTLHDGSYDWAFVHDEGTFTDSGTSTCHAAPPIPDNTAPTTTIACAGSACSGWYLGSTQVTLSGLDNIGGRGVDKTYYTTDGSAPTTSSTVYTGPFSLTDTSTVRFFSVDLAGNAEAAKSQLVQVDGTPPATSIACDGSTCASDFYTSAVSVTLPASDGAGGSGVAATYYTTDGTTPTIASPTYSGAFSLTQSRTVKFFSVDVAGNVESVGTRLVQVDTTAPSTTIACNGGNCTSGWYTSAVSVTLAASPGNGGSDVAATYYTTDGSTPTAASPTYTGAFSLTQTRTVKYYSVNLAGAAETVKTQVVQVDSAPPTSSIACNGGTCSTGWYTAAVSVTLSASDGTGGSGVAATYYTTDGSTPTIASTRYTTAISITQARTVKFISVDVAGNVEAVRSQLVQVDTAAPTTSIACKGATCSTGWYAGAVTVTLSASDGSGGSGIAATYYTTNGTTPTTSSPTYTGAFTLSTTTTVRFFSVDVSGRAEAPKSQIVQVDATAPTTSIACGGSACSTGWYLASVSVTLPATDSGGSGLSRTYYTTDGSTPTASSTRYTGSFSVNSTRTVKYFSVDVAGNAETVKSRLIQIDANAPTTSVTCNNANCSGSTYNGPVTIRLNASDTGGSTLSSTHYTTNGTTPTLSSPTYTGAFVMNTTATLRFRSWDVAGNVESVKSQTIRIVADRAPVARLVVSPSSGRVPLPVTANASTSTDTDAWPIASYRFSFGDGTAAVTGTAATVTHTFASRGLFIVTLTVTDTLGMSSTVTQLVTVT